MMTKDKDSALIEVGKRLKLLRLYAGFKRTGCAKAIGVSPATLSCWENGTGSHISRRNREKMKQAFKAAGVNFEETWLIEGKGLLPNLPSSLNLENIKNIPSTINLNTLSFRKEVEAFLVENQVYEGPILSEIENNTMLPILKKGDLTAGILMDVNLINFSDEQICIIKHPDESTDIRKVSRGKSPYHFDLTYICYDKECTKPMKVKDAEIKIMAPLLRLWRSL